MGCIKQQYQSINELMKYKIIMSNKIIFILLVLSIVFCQQNSPSDQNQLQPQPSLATESSRQQAQSLSTERSDTKMTSETGKFQKVSFMLDQQAKRIITICIAGVVLSACFLKRMCGHSKTLQIEPEVTPQPQISIKEVTQPGLFTSQIDENPSLCCTIQSIKSKYLIDQLKNELEVTKCSKVVPKTIV